MGSLWCLAPAKINLGLAIERKRPDGFHDIRTEMRTVTLFDRVEISWPGRGRLMSGNLDISESPNLMLDASAAMAKQYVRPIDFDIRLDKRIPVAAGLGGGSSDAAAIIRLLATRWNLGREESASLNDLASTIGSDVPFFLTGGRALVQGRGERVTPLPDESPNWYLLVTPDVLLEQKTSRLYASLDPSDFTLGNQTGRDMKNAFLHPLRTLSPQFAAFHDTLVQHVGFNVFHLSGAGPTLFALKPTLDETVSLATKVSLDSESNLHLHICRDVPRPSPLG